MAIFHLSIRRVSRARGQSSVAASAYRTGTVLLDERTGLTHDFRKKRGVLFSNLILPEGAPDWNRFELWNQIEAAEKRVNSCPARDCVAALPFECSLSEQMLLADEMGQWISGRHRVAVDWAMHRPVSESDNRNIHVHFLFSSRRLSPNGVAEKTRELDSQTEGPLEIRAWRQKWAVLVNEALSRQFIELRVDHRSHFERGIFDIPTIKEGRGPSAFFKKKKNEEFRIINSKLHELHLNQLHDQSHVGDGILEGIYINESPMEVEVGHLSSMRRRSGF